MKEEELTFPTILHHKTMKLKITHPMEEGEMIYPIRKTLQPSQMQSAQCCTNRLCTSNVCTNILIDNG